MINFIEYFNMAIFILLTLCYCYQFFYVFVTFFKKHKPIEVKKQHKYAFLIAARNESAVIGSLLDSIRKQDYPAELIHVFVVADNCTDNTAEVCAQHGATVYTRENLEQVGKGYALDFAFKKIAADFGEDAFEGFFIFDADNLLTKNYVTEMNKTFDAGYRIITSYRNSKNYDTNWISAGYSLWFLREAKYLNHSRMLLGTSCAVSGTGFLVSNEIVKRNDGWHFHLLTEDIEFSIASVIQGETIGYCPSAHFYDEQPITFRQSWNQRLRWSKGFLQVFHAYGKKLSAKALHGSFACYDMLMTIAPAMFISILGVFVNLIFFLVGLALFPFMPIFQLMLQTTLISLLTTAFNLYLLLFSIGLLTTITEWKEIHAKPYKKILYAFTFPFFMFTYLPIAITALFKKVEWTPIEHTITKSVDDIRQEKS
ncbi:MAG: glycosyltransferase family 2 protein [Clostridiales bacterium]|nr:glycosyltransferase family 2 protein [Clostridiales bacterium]